MEFRIRYASNIASIREEEENEIIKFNRLDDFIKWIEKCGFPVIINYNTHKTSIPREIYIYNDYIE